MRHTVLVALAVIATTSSCARALRVPHTDAPPIVGTFEHGINQRTKVFDVEVPEVKKDTQRSDSVTLKYGGAKLGGSETQQQRSNLTVLRGGQPLVSVECLSRQEGVTVSRTEFSRHTLTCSGAGFALEVQEPRADVFVGSARVGPVEVAFESTDEMEKGIPQYPTGFHLKANGRWVATFEYFQGGKAYLRPDLAGPERDAVLAVVVVLQSTDGWFVNDLGRNQARPFGM
ncbi:MAG: hypothetical protein AB1730_07265 [Myxococcota bacterium]|jgi:hypothetical protein